MNRIDKKFKELKKDGKKALIVFITAGYPSLKTTEKLIYEFCRIGVDIIELGVPFSDPLADGPVIQEASGYALEHKVYLTEIIDLVRRVRKSCEVPICLMTYYNPVFAFGEEKFAVQAVKAGVDGVIIPDLPPEEALAFRKAADKQKLATIFFVAPTTHKERIKFIDRVSRGFIYYVSLTGVTGARKKLPADLLSHLKLVKKQIKNPLCVGFGISTPKQVKEISRFCSGVIVGSAVVRKIRENIGRPDLLKKVSRFVARLR